MSVLIRNMDMPKNCDECRIMTYEDTNPHEIVLDKKFESIAKAGVIHANDPSYKMTLFGLDVRFDNLPDGVEFIVN